MDQAPCTTAVRHRYGDDGVAMVEFAFVMSLLFMLIYGIINFGYILSFKQDLTRVAAEGARAGAVAYPGSQAVTDAHDATTQSITAIGKTCNNGTGMTCLVTLHDCPDSIPDTNMESTKQDCVQVTVSYNYKDFPILAPPPIISSFMPKTITATSDARVNS